MKFHLSKGNKEIALGNEISMWFYLNLLNLLGGKICPVVGSSSY